MLMQKQNWDSCCSKNKAASLLREKQAPFLRYTVDWCAMFIIQYKPYLFAPVSHGFIQNKSRPTLWQGSLTTYKSTQGHEKMLYLLSKISSYQIQVLTGIRVFKDALKKATSFGANGGWDEIVCVKKKRKSHSFPVCRQPSSYFWWCTAETQGSRFDLSLFLVFRDRRILKRIKKSIWIKTTIISQSLRKSKRS